MQVNKISSYNTNFTSRVYISKWHRGKEEDRLFYKSPEFINEVQKLEDNGINDIVVFENSTANGICMTVKDNKNISNVHKINNPYDTEETLTFYDIDEAYETCRKELDYLSTRRRFPSKLNKYIIS